MFNNVSDFKTMKSVRFYEIGYDELIVMEDYKRSSSSSSSTFSSCSTMDQKPKRPTWKKPLFLEEYRTYGYTKYVNRKPFKISANNEVYVKIYDIPRILYGGIRTNRYRGGFTVKNTSDRTVYFDKYTILESLLTDYEQLNVEQFMMI
jgi:hypothetical protein